MFAGIAVYMPQAWEEAVNILLGICLLPTPWALGFADQSTPTANAAVVGILVVALGIWAMLRDTDFRKSRERHQAPGTR